MTRKTDAKKEKIQNLLAEFRSKHQILVDRERVEKVEVDPFTGWPENQIVRLFWQQKGVSFSVILTEEGLANAEIYDDHVECEDHEGEPIELQFLTVDAALAAS